MVGLKTFWILFTLFVLAACVPQTKQTECGSNEAFNASLRTCVPIVGGPSSFVKINTYSPASVIAKSKGDTALQSFSITVSNPYNQAYTIRWERVFNGTPVALACNDLTTCAPFSPYYLGYTLGQIGMHVITAKLYVGSDVVDTHNFELKVDDFPKPTITASSILPSPTFFNVSFYPTDGAQPFSFNVKNNNTLAAADNWLVEWTVAKNGVQIATESDFFTDLTASGTNLGSLDATPFNPSAVGYGVGSYTIRAVVRNNPPFPAPVQIVDERLWTVTVAHPALANVTNVTLPVSGVSTTAHNGVAYPDYPAYSWLITSTVTQPQYCVTLSDADGTYASDGLGLSIRWYLDGIGSEIYTKSTALPVEPGPSTSGVYCLIDGTFNPALLKFTNATTTSSQLHKVTVRIYDERTNLELQPSNVLSGTYPIEWQVNVAPTNSTPVATFGALPAGCTSGGSFAKNNCPVTQGTPFNISFSVTDDFYKPSTGSAKFMWDLKLVSTLTGTDVVTYSKYTSASKAFAGALPANCSLSSETWTCSLEVPHYTASGPLNPNGPYQVVLTLQDQDSPVGGAGLTAVQLKWNLKVTEVNGGTSPVITAQTTAGPSNVYRSSPAPIVNLDPAGTNFATELDYVSFNIGVQDNELDDFDYGVYLCGSGSTPVTCNSPQLVTASLQSYVRSLFAALDLTTFTPTVNAITVAMPTAFRLSETLLLSTLGQDVDTVTSVPVYFKVTVTDKPTTLPVASRVTDNEIYTVYVRNYNPAPTFATSGQVPAFNTAGTAYTIMSGFPFTIDPGTITDTSTAAAEKSTITYGWYANDGLGWQLIDSSSNKSKLVWTPSHLASGTIEIKVCIGDNTNANKVLSPSAGGNCSSSWFFSPKSFLAKPTPTAAINVSSEVAVWKDTADGDASKEVIYTAYVGSDNFIYVNKTVLDATTGLNATNTETVSFASLPSGAAAYSVSKLSLTGTADSLYIAYLADASVGANLVPRLRRINKNFSATELKSGYAHGGKFGFTYDATSFIDVTDCAVCTKVDPTSTTPAKISFSAGVPVTKTITINTVVFTATNAPASGAQEFCESVACSANDTVLSLVAKINASTNPKLQGITAVANNADLELYGTEGFDDLDWDGSTASSINVATGQMGKIFVVGSYWYIPFINSALTGSSFNNISILRGEIDKKLHAATLGQDDVSTGQAVVFDSELDPSNNDLVLAYTQVTTGTLKLTRLKYDGASSYGNYAPAYIMTLFTGYQFEDVKIAAQSAGNANVYVLAKELSANGGEYHLGRYSAAFTNLSTALFEDFLSTRLESTDSTSTYVSDVLISNPVLKSVPASSDARLFFNSGSATRVARFKSDNIVACGECMSIGYSGTNSQIALSDVSTLTLGTAGLLGENVRNTLFTFSNYTNGAQEPQVGLINLQPETIQSTTINNIWRPAFSK